jgi:hypothetical protein
VAGWPPFEPGGDALGQLITGSRSMSLPQWWLLVLGVIGLMAIRRVAALGWALVGAGVFAVLFVLSAYDTSPIVAELTKAWWGDSWRLAAFATAGLVVLAAVGLTVVADALGGVFRFRAGRGVAFGVVLVALLGLTRGLYIGRNTARLAQLFPDGPVVSHQDVAAMAKLATLAPAGSLVLNDPYDGSPWMFALDDVRPVFGQPVTLPQDEPGIGAQRMLLLTEFNRLDTDPAVQKAVRDLHVEYVYLGGGFLTPQLSRSSGLENLDKVSDLTLVYANSAAKIYRITM